VYNKTIILDILKTLSNNCLLFFFAVSVMEIKNLQRSEQALFLASRLCHSISRSCLCHARLCFNLSLNILSNIKIFWVIFFYKKIPLSRCVEYVTGQWVSEWVSEWVRDVCMSHQSDWIYYKQPIKFLVIKVNGMWEDLIPIKFRTAVFILL